MNIENFKFVRGVGDYDALFWDSDEQRTEALLPFVDGMLNTKGPLELTLKRGFFAADFGVRIIAPTILEHVGKTEWAEQLRGVSPIIDGESARGAREVTRAVRKAAAAAAAADADAYGVRIIVVDEEVRNVVLVSRSIFVGIGNNAVDDVIHPRKKDPGAVVIPGPGSVMGDTVLRDLVGPVNLDVRRLAPGSPIDRHVPYNGVGAGEHGFCNKNVQRLMESTKDLK